MILQVAKRIVNVRFTRCMEFKNDSNGGKNEMDQRGEQPRRMRLAESERRSGADDVRTERQRRTAKPGRRTQNEGAGAERRRQRPDPDRRQTVRNAGGDGMRPERRRYTEERSGQASSARTEYLASSGTRRRYDRERSVTETTERRSEGRETAAAQETVPDGLQQKLSARKRQKRNRILAGIGIGALGIYIAVAVYFGSHFYEDTEIYGIDCSQQTADTVKAEVAKRLDDYRLEIKERGGQSEYLTAEQIGLTFVDDSSINRMLKAQKSFLWPVMILLKRSDVASVAFSYDRDAAVQAFSALDCMNPREEITPEDAYVKATDTGFEVAPEVMGTMLDDTKARQALIDALDAGQSVFSLEESGCYVNPEVYSDDGALQEEAEKKSALAKAYITYDFGDRKEVVNAPVIADWIVTRTDGEYVIDEVAVTDYVEDLAAKYDTFGLTREFYTSLGTNVTLSGGDYGWCMDQDATVVALLNALADGYQGTMEPEYLYTAKSRDTNDIGDTYVEICISQQRMWCYQYGTCIVDTPVVTGNPNKGNATPAGGVWAIDAMKRNAVLVGEGYQSPVDFWMPFNGNIGIHDMQTRAYFGGTIYLTNGSHGCINTPYEQAQTIFNAVSVGTPVIVYE